MTKKITFLIAAALMLLTMIVSPGRAVGQTRTEQTASYGFETGDTGWTATSFVTNNTAITAHGGSKYGATNGGSTANVTYDTKVANPQSLTCYYSKTTTNTNTGSHFEIQVSTNNSTWTTVESGLGMNEVTKGTWYELTADLSSYSDVYVRVYYTGTSAVRALDDITLTYDDGQSPSTDPVISFSPTSVTLGDVLVNNEASTTFTVSQSNLEEGISLSVDNGELSQNNIDKDADPTSITWTYTPTTAGAISATVTATSGETSQTLEISGTAIAPVEGYDVDFEFAANMYPNWTFDNMTTYQTGSITAHGGTYYGTTGGKATASITTASTVETPGTLTCYVSKQSGNTTSSTWYIQVSSDGSDWENVEEQSATSMSQGSWVEFSADLSSYSDVYVRVYYSGSTAVRNIDDITLTMASATDVATPTFSPASGEEFGNDGLEVTISCETENTTIYYTLDGTDPDDESEEYTGAIHLIATTTIKAIAYDNEDNASNVATATYTYVDPDAPGTENNPYTVAQARAAIDAGTGVTGVYATGIVSAIPTAWSTQWNNITFNIVDESGDDDFLQAFRCVSTNTADASTVAVGDIVVVYGNLKLYQSTYEFDASCQLISLEHPAVTVEAPTFSPAAGTYAESQTVTMSCTTEGAAIHYTTDGTEPDGNSTQYSEPISVSTTTTFKAKAIKGSNMSSVVTATYHINSASSPYTVAQALAFHEYPTSTIWVHGIVSTAPTQAPTNSGQLTYYISDDGTAGENNQLEVYKGLGLNGAAFTAQDDIQVGDIVTITGIVKIYSSTIEFDTNNQLTYFERPTPTVPTITVDPATVNAPYAGADGTLTVTYENITEIIADVWFCNAAGTETATYNWITAEINNDNNVYYIIDANTGAARTAYFKVLAYDDDLQEVYSNLVTINQAAYVAPTYAELPFSFDEGRADIATTAGLYQEGLGTDYGSSPKLKFDGTGDWVLLQFSERPGTLTFDIKGNSFSGGTFTIQTSVDGVTYTALQAYTELGDTQSVEFGNLAEDVRYIKWIYTNKASGNVGLGNIALAQYVEPQPSITITPAAITEVPCYGGGGLLEVTYANMGDTPNPQIIKCDSDGNPATYDWLTAEFENGTANIRGTISANNSNADRTAYLKVCGTAVNSETVCSNIVSITQLAYPTITTATLPFAFDGDNEELATTAGLAQAGLGSSYGDSPKLKFKETGSFVILHFNEAPNTLTFDIKGDGFDGTFKVQTSADNVTYTDLKEYTSSNLTDNLVSESFNTLNANVRYIKWVYTAATSGKVRLGNIGLTNFSPSITLNTYAISVDANQHDGTLDATYEFIDFTNDPEVVWFESDGVTPAANDPDWVVAIINTDKDFDYTIVENNDAASRTAYFKVYALAETSDNDVYSDLVTVTQEGKVTLYTIMFDTDGGTFVGNNDFNSEIVQKQTGVYSLPSATKDNVTFAGWKLNGTDDIYAAGAQYEVTADVSFTAQWSNAVTATITFGSAEGSTNINSTSVTGDDSAGNTWTITTVFSGQQSFTPNPSYSQVGASSKPAESITFTTTLANEVNITAFSAKFGGFSNTAGDIALIVDETTIGTGSLNASEDVVVTNTTTESGTVLTVTVTNIAKGVKCYYISYTYEVDNTPSISINPGPYDLNSEGGDAVLPVTYTNMPTDPQAEVIFYESNGETHASYDWITAIINGDGNVAGHIDANTGDARSAYFKVKGIDANNSPVYSALVTINQAAPAVAHSITIDSNIEHGTVVANQTSAVASTTITLTVTPDSGYQLASITATKVTSSESITLTQDGDNYTFAMPEDDVLVTATFTEIPAGATYTLVETDNDIVPGQHYIIVGIGGTDSKYYAMGSQNTNYRNRVEVTANGTTIAYIEDVYEVVLSGYRDNTTNTWTIYDEVTVVDEHTGGYLYASGTGSSNYLSTQVTNSDRGQWSISINAESHKATIQANTTATERKILKYNHNSSRFSCYSGGQQDIYLYKKNNDKTYNFYSNTTVASLTVANDGACIVHEDVALNVTGTITNNGGADNLLIKDGGQLIHNNAVNATLQKNITAWTTKDVGGWYFIASPVHNFSTETLISNGTGHYDLFAYDEPTAYWRSNTGTGPGSAPFDKLERGKGYLYANESNVTLNFAGEMVGTNDNISLPLSYACTYDDVKGFNLVGNPYTCNIMSGNMLIGSTPVLPIYVINDEGRTKLTAVTTDTYAIKPGEGFFVQATATNQTLTINPTAKDNFEFRYIKIVAGNENGYDNAFIQLEQGNTLRKMDIAETTSVYVINDGDDYAAARVEELAGTMPVHFKAVEDGEFTITINAKNIEASTMMLFDNQTGELIDLLETPTYAFKASAEDDDNRFKLIFDFNNNYNGVDDNYVNGNFAYQNGDELFVSGDGTLQVFDVMGRFVMSKEIHGSESVSVSAFETGVYMLRFVGENIMTQKIVVR